MDRYIERKLKKPITKREVRKIGQKLYELTGMRGVIIGAPIYLRNGSYELPLILASASRQDRDCGSITVDRSGRVTRNIRKSACLWAVAADGNHDFC